MTPEHDRNCNSDGCAPGACDSRALESLLTGAMGTEPIPEAKIQDTVVRARRQALMRQRRMVAASATAFFFLLGGATFWRWSGRTADEIDFTKALEISQGMGNYPRDRVQLAMGKIFNETKRLIVMLREHGAYTAALRNDGIAALDSPLPLPITYQGFGLEVLRAKLKRKEPLTPDDQRTAHAAVTAAVSATRYLRARDPSLQKSADLMLKYFRAELLKGEQ